MTSLAEERDQLDKREAEMREMVRLAEAKRSWFNGFREWVESVAGFLDEKVCRKFLFWHVLILINSLWAHSSRKSRN